MINDKFIYNNAGDIILLSKCNNCIHKYKVSVGCEAFPNGIPDKILTGEHNHKEPYKGDNGIRFEPIEKT